MGEGAEVILWVILCLVDGVSDAVMYYNHPVRTHMRPNEHVWYFVRRILTSVAIFGLNPILIIFSGLVFPALHDGSQYFTVNRLTGGRVYKRGFFSEPVDGTARWDFSLIERVVMAGVGLLLLIVCSLS